MGNKASFVFAALAVCTAPLAACQTTAASSAAPQISETSQLNLSSRVILAELKQIGKDPLIPGAQNELSTAYVNYDFVVGPGNNLNTAKAKDAVNNLSKALSATGVRSVVRAVTAKPGARIRYRLVTENSPSALPQLSNNATDTLPIGVYHFWAERNGVPTSDQTEEFRVILPEVTLDIEERGG